MKPKFSLVRPDAWICEPSYLQIAWEAIDLETGRPLQVLVAGITDDGGEVLARELARAEDLIGPPPPPETYLPLGGDMLVGWMTGEVSDEWRGRAVGLLRSLWCGVPTRFRDRAGRLYAGPWADLMVSPADCVLYIGLVHRAVHQWWGPNPSPWCPELGKLWRDLGAPTTPLKDCMRF